ncbi:MAG: hypothetical protein ACJ72W_07900 [Actinoallomurus sp.]
MMNLKRLVLTAGGAVAMMSLALAQPPGGKSGDAPPKERPKAAGANSIVERMMAFDKNKDGKLTRDEITDERLLRLFDRADANKDGVVTREELEALAAKMAAEEPRGGRGGPGGPGGRGPGGPGGFGGPPGGRMQPGQVLPPFLQEQLNLTDDQKKQLAELQSDVDAKLAKLLTDSQKQQLKELRDRGSGGRGGPGGPPGGRPPHPDGDGRPE